MSAHAPPPTLHVVDANDFITHVNAEWLAFALENHASHLTPHTVVGTSLWQHITEPTTRYIYRTLIQQVRETNRPHRLPFRCDSAEVRRHVELRIAHRGQGVVEFESHIVSHEIRLALGFLDPRIPRSDEQVTQCGWCKRVAAPDWVEVEEAVGRLRWFEQPRPPQITHGICEDCQSILLEHVTPPKSGDPGHIPPV